MKIALTGFAGAGKGLVAELIQEILKDKAQTKGSFAFPIKEFFRKLCNMTDQHLYGEFKEIPMTFIITPESFNEAAKFYMDYGLDNHVSFDRMWDRFVIVLQDNLNGVGKEGYWTLHSISSRRLQQLLGTEIIRHFKDTTWVDVALDNNYNIIDDLRFINEAKLLKEDGFLIVRVLGKDTRIEDETAKAHASEQEIPLIAEDEILHNYFASYDAESRASLKARVVTMLFNNNLLI